MDKLLNRETIRALLPKYKASYVMEKTGLCASVIWRFQTEKATAYMSTHQKLSDFLIAEFEALKSQIKG